MAFFPLLLSELTQQFGKSVTRIIIRRHFHHHQVVL